MVAFENLYRRSMFYLKWPSCRNLDLDKFTFLAWFGVLSFCYWGILFVCFVCFSFLFCPNIFLYSPPLDIDQLKLILRLVGTPGAELLKKISSESVSWCLDCNYLPCWEPLPLPFCQSVLWPGYVCKHMCPLCADSRMRCVCIHVPACSHAWVCFVFSLSGYNTGARELVLGGRITVSEIWDSHSFQEMENLLSPFSNPDIIFLRVSLKGSFHFFG